MDRPPHRPRLERYALAFAIALLGAACVAQQPEEVEQSSDPLLLGHARWCGTAPASGYCDIGDRR